MASWKKYFQTVPPQAKIQAKLAQIHATSAAEQVQNGINSKFNSFLPEVYSGAPNRIERYAQYEQMDMDSDINRSLDTIADFCTQTDEDATTPFLIHYKDKVSDSETNILTTALQQWTSINRFNQRLWRIVRSTLKYGDQFFIRDPETYKWIWCDPSKIEKVIVNETKGKQIEQYVIRDLDINLESLSATSLISHDQFGYPGGYPRTLIPSAAGSTYYGQADSPSSRTRRWNNPPGSTNVKAEHVVHLSLSEGLDANWPFGNSLLENVFKTFKQKDLLEDAILIYRIQRAPERRVFYIDVGNLPGNRALQYLERVKNEIHQRRIPNRTGGGANVIDASYNPLATLEDYFFAVGTDNRGSRVETLPGGENLGQIDDLRWFSNKLFRGLGIPSSYLPTGPDDSQSVYNDGKVGTAYMSEFRFSKFCQRIQNLVGVIFDNEFKLFLKMRGLEIHSSLFELRFNPPQSFSKYRQMEMDSSQINLFSSVMASDASKYMSKRYALERYLGWTKDEINNNEQLWREENETRVKKNLKVAPAAEGLPGLGGVGIRTTPELPGAPGGMGMSELETPPGTEMPSPSETTPTAPLAPGAEAGGPGPTPPGAAPA